MYTTEEAVALRLSQDAVDLRTDDAPAAISDCVAEAVARIDAHLAALYSPLILGNNSWVQYAARAFAVYFACIRRGEPPPASVEKEYERYSDELMKFASRTMTLPGVPTSPGGVTVSNQRVDLTRHPALRIERPRSHPTGGQRPRRNIDPSSDTARR